MYYIERVKYFLCNYIILINLTNSWSKNINKVINRVKKDIVKEK